MRDGRPAMRDGQRFFWTAGFLGMPTDLLCVSADLLCVSAHQLSEATA
jgi:hypothetical protein